MKSIGILKVNGLTSQPEGSLVINAVAATWEATLPELSDKDLEHAVFSYLRNCTEPRWPTPADLRRHAPGGHEGQVDTADAAWGELMRGLSRYGTGPGRLLNPLLADDDPTHPVYGVRWDWTGSPAERAAKQAALDDIGGTDHLLRAETWRDGAEGQLRHAYRNAFRARRTRERFEAEEGTVLRLLDRRPALEGEGRGVS